MNPLAAELNERVCTISIGATDIRVAFSCIAKEHIEAMFDSIFRRPLTFNNLTNKVLNGTLEAVSR